MMLGAALSPAAGAQPAAGEILPYPELREVNLEWHPKDEESRARSPRRYCCHTLIVPARLATELLYP